MPPQSLTVVKSEPLPNLTVTKSEPAKAPPTLGQQVVDFIANSPQAQMLVGAGKGAGHTFETLGKLWHLIPGVSEALDAAVPKVMSAIPGLRGGTGAPSPGLSRQAFSEADAATKPEGAFQHAGYLTEQVTEAVAPGGAVAKVGQKVATAIAPKLAPVIGQTAAKILPRAAVEAGGNAAISFAQGGDPKIAAVLGAAAPVVGAAVTAAAPTIASRLKSISGKQVHQALGAGKERFKAMAERLTPEILRRGLKGSREALVEQATSKASQAGQHIAGLLEQHGDQPIPTSSVITALEEAKDAFRTTTTMTMAEAMRKGLAKPGKAWNWKLSDGTRMLENDMVEQSVEFEPRAIQQLASLQKIIRDLGQEATVAQIVGVRRAWDKVVDQAGGFAQRAGGAIGVPLKDASEAAAKREATSAIRRLLDAEVPDLSAINKEFSFWKGLQDVLKQTIKRTQPHGQGLASVIKQTAGQTAGATLGAIAGHSMGGGMAEGAIVGMLVGQGAKMFHAVTTSPAWRLASAQTKNRIAEALASGNHTEAVYQFQRILATQGSKAGGALTPAPSGGR